MSNAIEREYPNLPPDQRRIVDAGLVFAIWYDEPGASRFLARGPEDDPAYREGDRWLYPTGTIKVDIAMKAIEMEMVAGKVPDSRVKAVLYVFFRNVLVHEIEHVQEYVEQPLHDLRKDPQECPDGLCDPVRLEGTRLKMEYEFRALRRNFKEVLCRMNQHEIDYAAQWLRDHPEYLTPRTRGLPDMLRKIDLRNAIRPGAKLFYGGMYYPAVLAKKCAEKGLSSEECQEVRSYMDFNRRNDNLLLDAYPYLQTVFNRLEKCLPPLTP